MPCPPLVVERTPALAQPLSPHPRALRETGRHLSPRLGLHLACGLITRRAANWAALRNRLFRLYARPSCRSGVSDRRSLCGPQPQLRLPSSTTSFAVRAPGRTRWCGDAHLFPGYPSLVRSLHRDLGCRCAEPQSVCRCFSQPRRSSCFVAASGYDPFIVRPGRARTPEPRRVRRRDEWRAKAFIANQTMTHTDGDEKVRTVYKCLWVRRDDRLRGWIPCSFSFSGARARRGLEG
jgi:hypothetical protein